MLYQPDASQNTTSQRLSQLPWNHLLAFILKPSRVRGWVDFFYIYSYCIIIVLICMAAWQVKFSNNKDLLYACRLKTRCLSGLRFERVCANYWQEEKRLKINGQTSSRGDHIFVVLMAPRVVLARKCLETLELVGIDA